ncbi:unnamed protein product [Sphagnum tenellum]
MRGAGEKTAATSGETATVHQEAGLGSGLGTNARQCEQWDAVRDSAYISRTVDYTRLLIDANRVENQNPHALAFLFGISRTPIDVVLSVVNYKALAPMGMGWNFRGMALAIVVWETVCPVFVNRQTDRAITGLLPGHAPIWRDRGLRRQRGPAQPQRGTQERRGYQYGFHEDVLQSIEQTPEQLADEQSWYDQRAQGLHPDDEEPSDAESEGEPRASAVHPPPDESSGAVPRRPTQGAEPTSARPAPTQGTRTATALPPPPTSTPREPLAAAHPMSQNLDAGMTEDSRRDRPWLQGCVKCGSILHGGRFCPVPRRELKSDFRRHPRPTEGTEGGVQPPPAADNPDAARCWERCGLCRCERGHRAVRSLTTCLTWSLTRRTTPRMMPADEATTSAQEQDEPAGDETAGNWDAPPRDDILEDSNAEDGEEGSVTQVNLKRLKEQITVKSSSWKIRICKPFGIQITRGVLARLKGNATNHLFYVNVRTDVFSLGLVV